MYSVATINSLFLAVLRSNDFLSNVMLHAVREAFPPKTDTTTVRSYITKVKFMENVCILNTFVLYHVRTFET